ncbi:MAG: endo alpha-1,4 polygalactosaminidase [Huintestinicola sp.]
MNRLLKISAVILSAALFFCGCGAEKTVGAKDYGVFLSIESAEIEKAVGYNTVVIDAQYFSAEDIAFLQEQGSEVYSYLNIGSLENFRDYCEDYSEYTLGKYENWDEEEWINTASPEWQEFLVSLAEELLGKGIDGFFVDNCDVYYIYPEDEIFDGLTIILKQLMSYGKPVIINGGDTYVTAYREKYGSAKDIMTGVNQESVFTAIDFENGSFSAQTKEERKYFSDYIEACENDGADVFLIEYTTDKKLVEQIEEYCFKKGYRFYISDSLELD